MAKSRVSVLLRSPKGQVFRVKALVDTGNTIHQGSAMSIELARKLGLKWAGPTRRVGTAAQGKGLTSVGRAEELKMMVGGKERTLQPEIFYGLSHSLNLGAAWLTQQQVAVDFSQQPPVLRLGGEERNLW